MISQTGSSLRYRISIKSVQKKGVLTVRSKKIFIFLVFVLLIPFSLKVEAETELRQPIPYFSVSHYDIRVEIFPAQKSLSAVAVLKVQTPIMDAGTIRIYLHDEFTIHSVSADGNNLNFIIPQEVKKKPMYSPSAKPIEIDLPRADNTDGLQEIKIVYSGPITRMINRVNLISESLTEIALYCSWYPLLEDKQNFTYSLAVTVPEDQKTISDGVLCGETKESGKITRLFERRSPGGDIPLIASNNIKVKVRETAAIKAEIYYREIDDQAVDTALDQAVRAASILTAKLGDPINKGRLTVVYSPRGGWGYSRIPLIVGSENRYKTRLQNRDGIIDNFHGLAHEIAHFWWSIADSSSSEDWINEGLAEWSSLYVLEQVFGREEVNKILNNYRNEILELNNAKPLLQTKRDDFHTAYILFYEKGAYIFEMLRTKLDEDRLFSILKNFYFKNRGRREAITSDLVSDIVNEGGEEIRPFLNELLNTNNLPKIYLEWKYQDGQVLGKLVIQDTALVNFPLEILFSSDSPSQEEIKIILVSTGDNPFILPLSFYPGQVVIDPNNRLLWIDTDLD